MADVKLDPDKIRNMNRAMGLNDDGSPKTPASKAAAPAPAAEHPVLKAVKDLYDQLSTALDPKAPREPLHRGKTVDQTVDDAINGGIADGNAENGRK